MMCTTMKIEWVRLSMEAYSDSVAPFGECEAMTDYRKAEAALGLAGDAYAPDCWAYYWMSVSIGQSNDYDSRTGQRISRQMEFQPIG